MKTLIIGHARHGKDTVAEIIREEHGLTFESSSQAAARIFLYDVLKEKYGYQSAEECFEDRVNHRAEWYDLICEYNREDKTRLAREILKTSDMYVGMRDREEIETCIDRKVFERIIAVYDHRKPKENRSSFNMSLDVADDIILNSGTLEDLREKVKELEF